MTIQAGQDIVASDFIAQSAGAADSGKGIKLTTSGWIDRSMLKGSFGGNGADGALNISSGTTTIDCAGASVVVKNYTSISITGTGNLAFSNPNNVTGTIVILRSQGDVIITTSSTHAIDMRNMGGGIGTATPILSPTTHGGGSGGSTSGRGANIYATGVHADIYALSLAGLCVPLINPIARFVLPGGNGALGAPGWNAGSGSGTGGTAGAAGLGAGGLYIECGGAYTFTTGEMDLSGANGGNGGNGTGFWSGGSGGGAGAGGNILVLYNLLISDTGTYNVAGSNTGGSPGSGSYGTPTAGAGGAANGSTIRALNTYFI